MPRILFVQYTNPAGYPPLEHSSKILANEGWEVLFLGTGSLGSNDLCFPPHPRIRLHKLSFAPSGWRQKLHYFWYILWVTAWVLRWRPRWIYASDLLATPPAYLLSFWPGINVIYHEHDSPQVDQPTFFQRVCMLTRRKIASRARLCILPNQKRLEVFQQETQATSKLFCVWNCPSRDEVAAPRAPHTGDIWVLYHGSIVPDRLPVTVIEALAQLPSNMKLRVAGYETTGHKGYVTELKNITQNLGIADRVEFVGTIPQRRDLLALCGQCDIGLALMPTASNDLNLQAMTGASNKPFDYLAGGLALIVSDLPDWRTMYIDTGYGLACDPNDVISIADALRWFYEHRAEMRTMGEKGRKKIASEWNYETQFYLPFFAH
jgi:glycosyltransferase involved in cell wall biosynthesis